MTEDLLLKLENRMMSLLTEVERLRQEVSALTDENDAIRQERESSKHKLVELLSLLDSVNGQEASRAPQPTANPTHRVVTANLVHG